MTRPGTARALLTRISRPAVLLAAMVALGGCLPSWNYEPEANRKKIEVELAHYRHDVYFSVDSQPSLVVMPRNVLWSRIFSFQLWVPVRLAVL